MGKNRNSTTGTKTTKDSKRESYECRQIKKKIYENTISTTTTTTTTTTTITTAYIVLPLPQPFLTYYHNHHN